MENTVIQNTFLKFEQNKKNRFSIKTLEPQKKQKNPRSSEKKTEVATLNNSHRNQHWGTKVVSRPAATSFWSEISIFILLLWSFL